MLPPPAARRAALLVYLMPIVAGVVSWTVIDEAMTTDKLVGATITLVGIALAQYAALPSRRLFARPGN